LASKFLQTDKTSVTLGAKVTRTELVRHTLRIAPFFFLAVALHAQSSCPRLKAPSPDPSKLLFTPQQEVEMGQIIRQQLESEFRVIDDDRVTALLKSVGQRVAAELPDVGLRYEFVLYDKPEVQAFGMPGGRIYVSRKIVAFLHNEDELAGLLGHELGHLAARQQALDMSRAFRDVLGLKALSPDEDLYERYNQLVESMRLKRLHPQTSEDEERSQNIADQLGVQAVARAGYAPAAFPNLLDRIMETKGKTGSWLSDLFGATRQDSRRLRAALKEVATLPTACIEVRSPSQSDEFHQWQAAVLHYQGIGHAEHLPGVLARKQLNDPLRGDVEYFRFSPDGKYLLAQDEGGIYVMTREPLRFVFRIDATNAQSAQFSPDSRQLVFFSSGLRVEVWDIDSQEQTSVADVPAIRGCRQAELSPDAKYLACLGTTMDLSLYDVAAGESIFKKESFFDLNPGFGELAAIYKFLFLLTHPEVATLRFSPDGHYFAASSRTRKDVIFDLSTKRVVNVSGALSTAMAYSFTFVGPNRIVGVDDFNPQKSPLVEFPSGKVLDHLPLGGTTLTAATNPKYILVRPLKENPVGAFDLDQKKLIFANRMSATDLWGDVWVSERLNGEIGLYKVGELTPYSKLQLPIGELGTLRAFTASPDLKWFAMSTRTRGGVWDLEKNERSRLFRGFQNAYYAPNAVFFMEFPEFEKAPRSMVVVSPVTKQLKDRPVDKDDDVTFFGDVFLRIKHNDTNRAVLRNLELTAFDMATAKPLWSRSFPKQGPRISGSPASGKLIFVWNAKADGLRDELARDPKLQANWNKQGPGDTDYFLEVLDARDGTVSGGAVVRTGKYSFLPESQQSAANWLVVTDNQNRVLLYSIATGEQKAKWFGSQPQISRNGDRLSLSNGRGRLLVFDLHTLKQCAEFSFANSVIADYFSQDGKRLVVLTNDQTVFTLDTSEDSGAMSSSQN
jgi:WD40 repeat protein